MGEFLDWGLNIQAIYTGSYRNSS